MKIDFLATAGHYARHLAPIYHALPEEKRGYFWLHDKIGRLYRELNLPLHRLNAKTALRRLRNSRRLLVTAASGDLFWANRAGRRSVFCEHGAGQSYFRPGYQPHSSYAGGPGRGRVELLLVPGPYPASENCKSYPWIPCVQIGCPKLDWWHNNPPRLPARPQVVALSCHWDCDICPESRSAWPELKSQLRTLAKAQDSGLQFLGHGHPRIFRKIERVYRQMGIEVVRDFTEVMDRAHLYVCDNSSTIFEFASTGRPVVLLNSPHYRKDFHHGLRFWTEADVGLQVDEPEQLLETIKEALQDPPEVAQRRREAVSRVYTYTDGRAADRAAHMIIALSEGVVV